MIFTVRTTGYPDSVRAAGRSVEPTADSLSTEYTDTWRGSRGHVLCIRTGSANFIIYSLMFDLSNWLLFSTSRRHV